MAADAAFLFFHGAQDRTRTCTPFGTSTSSLRVYQFHHLGNEHLVGPDGLEPPTYAL